MNKKILIIIVMVFIIGIIVGSFCLMTNQNHVLENSVNTKNNIPSKEQNNSNQKIAVIYFSATGTTKKVAEYIKNITNGDLIEIIPKEKYTDDDLNYGNDSSRANKEQNDSKARPEIANNINTDNYDIIFLGYPIWWGDVPKIILTFIDNHNLDGKTIIPFCTSGSTGISGSLNTLKKYNKDINWLDGERFSSSSSQSEVNNWVNSLNY